MKMLWFRYWPIFAVFIGMYVFKSGWVAILLYHAGLVFGIQQQRQNIRETRWKSSLPVFIGSIVVGLLAAPGVYFGLPLLASPAAATDLSERLSSLGLGGWQFWIFACYFFTIHPVLEETGWRVALMEKHPHPRLHDFEFALYHLFVLYWLFPDEWGLLAIAFVTLAVSAWFWRRLRDTHGMAAVIAFHATADLGVILAAYALAERG